MKFTNVNTQKIDSFLLKIYIITITIFFIQNKYEKKYYFFKKTFLLANPSIKIVIGISFFFKNIDINFLKLKKFI